MMTKKQHDKARMLATIDTLVRVIEDHVVAIDKEMERLQREKEYIAGRLEIIKGIREEWKNV